MPVSMPVPDVVNGNTVFFVEDVIYVLSGVDLAGLAFEFEFDSAGADGAEHDAEHALPTDEDADADEFAEDDNTELHFADDADADEDIQL